MRTLILAAVAASLTIPVGLTLPATKAEAAQRHHHKRYAYREWRGHDGRRYCRKPDGTTGLVVGGVAGALLGRTIDSRGDRSTGTILGAAAGALAGREVERGGNRCR